LAFAVNVIILVGFPKIKLDVHLLLRVKAPSKFYCKFKVMVFDKIVYAKNSQTHSGYSVCCSEFFSLKVLKVRNYLPG
jgi:hypothetical protein